MEKCQSLPFSSIIHTGALYLTGRDLNVSVIPETESDRGQSNLANCHSYASLRTWLHLQSTKTRAAGHRCENILDHIIWCVKTHPKSASCEVRLVTLNRGHTFWWQFTENIKEGSFCSFACLLLLLLASSSTTKLAHSIASVKTYFFRIPTQAADQLRHTTS